MSERQGVLIRNGVVTAGAIAALVLLLFFYLIVHNAVDRAALRRAAVAESTRLPTLAAPSPVAPQFAVLTSSSR